MKEMIELRIISSVTKIPEKDILGKSRRSEVAEARHLLYYLLKKKHSLSETGRLLNRTHSTVLHGIRRIEDLLSINDRRTVELIKKIEDERRKQNNLQSNNKAR